MSKSGIGTITFSAKRTLHIIATAIRLNISDASYESAMSTLTATASPQHWNGYPATRSSSFAIASFYHCKHRYGLSEQSLGPEQGKILCRKS